MKPVLPQVLHTFDDANGNVVQAIVYPFATETVSCPYCRRGVGKWCWSIRGRKKVSLPGKIHKARLRRHFAFLDKWKKNLTME